MCLNADCVRTTSCISVFATTEAVRSDVSSSAISPKNAPLSSSRTSRSSWSTVAVPLSITKKR